MTYHWTRTRLIEKLKNELGTQMKFRSNKSKDRPHCDGCVFFLLILYNFSPVVLEDTTLLMSLSYKILLLEPLCNSLSIT